MARVLVLAAIAIGTALRVYPLHVPFIHPDQESVPLQALSMIADGTWRPPDLVYPSAFLYLLRVSYAAAGVWGAAQDRLDLVLTYVRDPFPFLLTARVFAALFGIATIAVTARLGRVLGDAWTAGLAALFIATNVLHVRESHYGTADVPATALVTAALVLAVAYVRAPRRRTLVLASACAGLAAGFRYPAAVALAGVVTAVLVARGVDLRARLLALGSAAATALAVFFAASPFTLLELDRTWARLATQLLVARSTFLAAPGLPLQTLLPAVAGWTPLALAALGAGVLAATRPREGAPLFATGLLMLWPLTQAHRVFARYTLPLMPIVCVLAAIAIRAAVARLPHRVRPLAATALVAVALADPAWRTLALVRILAREDTRRTAGAWLAQMRETNPVWIAASTTGYWNPVLPLTLGAVAWRLDRKVTAELGARQRAANRGRPPSRVALYDESAGRLAALDRRGGLVVTTEHPVLGRGDRTPAEVRERLAARGTVVMRFVGLDVDAGNRTLFDPIDANFVPLRGIEALAAPGPTITVWYLRPRTGQG